MWPKFCHISDPTTPNLPKPYCRKGDIVFSERSGIYADFVSFRPFVAKSRAVISPIVGQICDFRPFDQIRNVALSVLGNSAFAPAGVSDLVEDWYVATYLSAFRPDDSELVDAALSNMGFRLSRKV